ncbi:type II secretion system protein [Virgibacillus indicus]|uniref:type II secretion system protein n=1 Tax=Virgibacillus indicus TaxID=2024554 RepID=UPI0013FE2A3B|nr:type II secretion system protein [Virgibacillus indicus]
MQNNKGFTLIEVLIALSVLLSAVSVIIPTITLLHQEKHVLSDRRAIAFHLHDEMQPFLWEGTNSSSALFYEKIQNKQVTFQFLTENEYIKGCASWKNVKEIKETYCLYGLPQR